MELKTPQDSPNTKILRALVWNNTSSPVHSFAPAVGGSPAITCEEGTKECTLEGIIDAVTPGLKSNRFNHRRPHIACSQPPIYDQANQGCEWSSESGLNKPSLSISHNTIATRRGIDKHLQLSTLRRMSNPSAILTQETKNALLTPHVEEVIPFTPVDQMAPVPIAPPPAPRQPLHSPKKAHKARISRIMLSREYTGFDTSKLDVNTTKSDKTHTLLETLLIPPKESETLPLLSPIKLIANYSCNDEAHTPFADASFSAFSENSPTLK